MAMTCGLPGSLLGLIRHDINTADLASHNLNPLISHRIPPKFYDIPCTLTTDHLKMTAGIGRIALANALDQKKAHQTQVAELILNLQSVLRGVTTDHLSSPPRARRANLAQALKHKDPIWSETPELNLNSKEVLRDRLLGQVLTHLFKRTE
jgi:hypothetical protein